MEHRNPAQTRRAAAKRLLNRLTVGIAFAAVAGVGLLSTIAAQTIPGQSAAASTSSSSATASLDGSSSTVSSSSGTPVAVSGGSR